MSQLTKTAIVTGASGGLGKAIAAAFINAGYNVVVSGTNEEKLIATVAELGVPERTLPVVADVTLQ